jgi:hypothetical protein
VCSYAKYQSYKLPPDELDSNSVQFGFSLFPVHTTGLLNTSWWIARAFFKPIGIMFYSNNPNGVVTTISGMLSGHIHIWNMLLVMSMVVQI